MTNPNPTPAPSSTPQAHTRSGIYRTPQGEAVMRNLYEDARRALNVPTEDSTIRTRFGDTHALLLGPQDAPPVVVFQGGNFLNPMTLAWFAPLAAHFRLIAPDTPGQPGLSAQTRLSGRDDSLGLWALDVLDAFGLDRAALVGPSHGAAAILRLARVAPRRIERAALVMPAGVTAPALWPLIRELAWPMLRYRLRRSNASLRAAGAPLFTGDPPETWLRVLGAVFDHVSVEADLPRPATKAELSAFDARVLVVAAERDVLFPGAGVLARAADLLPRGPETLMLPGGHVPDEAGLRRLREVLGVFLAAGDVRGAQVRRA
ncbi:alpha/beta fold hydrolase [Deinococcus pimensis]|uniref:alpha/beta fold hydrolase n=1 Tax=Deinococcus pimensis TaxID=309888 RepID=UPI0004B8D14F|nr:alpha/beta fold hydrolase [Deinococcus pimensis]